MYYVPIVDKITLSQKKAVQECGECRNEKW